MLNEHVFVFFADPAGFLLYVSCLFSFASCTHPHSLMVQRTNVYIQRKVEVEFAHSETETFKRNK